MVCVDGCVRGCEPVCESAYLSRLCIGGYVRGLVCRYVRGLMCVDMCGKVASDERGEYLWAR